MSNPGKLLMKIRAFSTAMLMLTCVLFIFVAHSALALKPLAQSCAPSADNAPDKNALPILTGTRLQGSPPKIDGIPDDAAWCGAYTSSDFKLQDGAAPKGTTRVNVAFDEKNLYVLVVCPETEADLKTLKADATQDDAANVWADDSV